MTVFFFCVGVVSFVGGRCGDKDGKKRRESWMRDWAPRVVSLPECLHGGALRANSGFSRRGSLFACLGDKLGRTDASPTVSCLGLQLLQV